MAAGFLRKIFGGAHDSNGKRLYEFLNIRRDGAFKSEIFLGARMHKLQRAGMECLPAEPERFKDIAVTCACAAIEWISQ